MDDHYDPLVSYGNAGSKLFQCAPLLSTRNFACFSVCVHVHQIFFNAVVSLTLSALGTPYREQSVVADTYKKLLVQQSLF